MTIETREKRGRGRVAARAAAVTALAAAVVLAAAPAHAATPHFILTPSFIAYTDSATPRTTTFYPIGDLPVGTHVIDGVNHTTRVYFGFDVGGVQRARLQQGRLVLIEDVANDCGKPRALVARPVTEFTSSNSWPTPQIPPAFPWRPCPIRRTAPPASPST